MFSRRVMMTEFRHKSGFTLLEVLVSVSILVVSMGIAYTSFSMVSRAWSKGLEMSENLSHGDFVMEQLVTGLRSAYYPGSRGERSRYGFYHTDSGVDPRSGDVISWVKIGASLVGDDNMLAGTPHRVEFLVEPGLDGASQAQVKAWRLYGVAEDFDPEEVEPIALSSRVTGFDCRTAWRKVDGEIEWMEEWDKTNRLPMAVELTLFLEPLETDEEPLELKRIVGIPVAAKAWK